MTRRIEFRLIDHGSDAGEMLASDAVAVITAFRELTYRVTRAVAEGPGLGRTNATIEQLSTVRVGLLPGSTVVSFNVGDAKALLDPLSEQVDDVFSSIVDGLLVNRRPSSVVEPVADAVDSLVVALAKAAPRVEITVGVGPPRLLETAHMSRTPWQRQSAPPTGEETVHGLLEMVDLHSARFRLRDAAGNTIDLIDVVEPEAAAAFVGSPVSARGFLTVGVGTQHHRLVAARVSSQPRLDSGLVTASDGVVDELLHDVAHLSPAPPMDLTDEELHELLEAIRAE